MPLEQDDINAAPGEQKSQNGTAICALEVNQVMSYGAIEFTSARFPRAFTGFACVMILAGCGGGSGSRGAPSAGIASNTSAPVQLGGAPSAGAGVQRSVLGPLDELLVRRAIENYRISKKRAKGPYQLVGADLNGNGVREAIVLFQGKDWCTRTAYLGKVRPVVRMRGLIRC